MEERKRKSGIDILGDVPWGTHFCQFYQTRGDLIDILVPYFKAGLENNEFCMWITSEPLITDKADKSLRKAVKNLDKYIKRGQIEILDYSQWYTKSGKFAADEVLQGWVNKENEAVKRGYDGLRLAGNTFWLEERDWRDFADYEVVVNNVFPKYRMLAVCPYSLDKCGASEVIDVVNSHQFALIRREGKWEIIESSERKHAAEKLQESERRFKELWDNAPVAYHTLDADGVITSVNKTETKLLAYKPEEMNGRPIFDFILPEQKGEAIKRFKKKIAGESVPRVDNRIYVRKDGSKVHVVIDDVVERNNRGQIIGARTTMVDITELKHAEESLKKSEERYRELVEKAESAILMDDEMGNFKYFNKKYAELFGYSYEEMKKQSIKSVVHPDDVERVMRIHRKRVQGKKAPSRYEFKGIKKDGSAIYLEVDAVELRDKDRIIGTRSYIWDITERKKAEEALRESEEKYRSLVERANDGIGLTEDKLMKYMNPRGAEILGYAVQEIIGTPFTDYIHPDEVQRVVSYYTRRMKGKKVPSKYESALIDRQGQKILVELNASVIPYQGKAVDMVIFREITERKKAEEELREKEAFNFALFQYNPVQTMVVDRQGKVVKVNMAKRMSGDRLPNIGDVMYKDYAGNHEMDMHAELTECLKSGKTKSFPELKYGDKFLSITIAPFPEGAIITSLDITERKRVEKEIKESREQIRNFAAHLGSAREQERTVIAREIHDELGQSLTALKMDLSWLYKKMPRDKALLPKRTKSMLGLVDTTIQSVKRISSELRPGLLDDLGLSAAIEWQGEEFQNHTGIRCEVSVEPEDIILDQERSIAIFRIFQEALANVARHAKATRVKASLKTKAGKLELKVRDNGRGITEEKISDPKSFGLIGIKERAQFLDGTVEIRGIRDKGTTITVRIPLLEKGKNDKNPHRG
jgi:PAS domain S-box-containing protein